MSAAFTALSTDARLSLTPEQCNALKSVFRAAEDARSMAILVFAIQYFKACQRTTERPFIHHSIIVERMKYYSSDNGLGNFNEADIGEFALWISKSNIEGDPALKAFRDALLETPTFRLLHSADALLRSLPRESGPVADAECRKQSIVSAQWCFACGFLFYRQGNLRDLIRSCEKSFKTYAARFREIMGAQDSLSISLGNSAISKIVSELDASLNSVLSGLKDRCPRKKRSGPSCITVSSRSTSLGATPSGSHPSIATSISRSRNISEARRSSSTTNAYHSFVDFGSFAQPETISKAQLSTNERASQFVSLTSFLTRMLGSSGNAI